MLPDKYKNHYIITRKRVLSTLLPLCDRYTLVAQVRKKLNNYYIIKCQLTYECK